MSIDGPQIPIGERTLISCNCSPVCLPRAISIPFSINGVSSGATNLLYLYGLPTSVMWPENTLRITEDS